MPADAFIRMDPHTVWVNHHENIKVPVAARITISNEIPSASSMAGMRATAARIQRVIADAVAQGITLRACGARWSFSDIAVVKDGWIIETDQLGWRFTVAKDDVDPASSFDAADLFLVQGGAKISKINEALETSTRRRALATSGASNGQTIGGALGTGIHGSAIEIGGLESQVAGIQLLSARANLWIERASAPALGSAFPAKLGAVLVRDDDLFEAAIMNLGMLGIVHAVLLQTTPRYLLNSQLVHIPYATLQHTLNTLDFTRPGLPASPRKPYFFQAILDPRDMATAYVAVRYAEMCPPEYVPDYNLKPASEPGTDLPRMIASAIAMFPVLRDTVVSELMKIELRARADRPADWSTPGETYSFTAAREGIASSGFAVRVADVTRALDIAQTAFQSHRAAPVVFTCRYTQASPGILSFTRYDPTCVFDVDGVDTPASRALIAQVADELDAAGIGFTQHWGKMNSLTQARVAAAYGSAVDRWTDARHRLLPDIAERDAFASPWLTSLGLGA